MRLDLRLGATFPKEYLELVNQLAMEAREAFNRCIEALTPEGGLALDWLVTAPGCRDTTRSQFFFRCCGLLLARELQKRGKPLEAVITDSPAQAGLVRELFGSGANAPKVLLEVPLTPKTFSRRPWVAALFDLALYLWMWLWARLTRPMAKPLPNTPLTLLDTFLGPGNPDNDHFYPGLLEHLDVQERRALVFVSTLAGVGFAAVPQVFIRLRRARRHLLPREDFLRLSDYFLAWRRALKTAKLPLGVGRFAGLDVAPLAREELSHLTAFDGIFVALLNERFPARLAAAGARVRLVVDWFENQAVDKGFNAGFSRAFPHTRHLGYLGFLTSPFYLSLSPIPAERRAGVLPQELRGIGPGSAGLLLEFLPEMPFAPAPAFRYRQSFIPQAPAVTPHSFTVLLPLPMPMPHYLAVLRGISAILHRLPTEITILVKRHPLVSQAALRQAFAKPWPERLRFVEGSFDEVVRRCHLVVSMTSSTALDSLARGIPVVIVGNQEGLTWDPVPAFGAFGIYRLVYRPEDLLAAILDHQKHIIERIEHHQATGHRFRKRYFTPVTRETVLQFLELTPGAH